MNEHRARVDELLDFEALQGRQQAAGTGHVDFVIERIVLAGEVEVGGEVDDIQDQRFVSGVMTTRFG
jgi:hypothetical protein